jgi:hypothetical protein
MIFRNAHNNTLTIKFFYYNKEESRKWRKRKAYSPRRRWRPLVLNLIRLVLSPNLKTPNPGFNPGFTPPFI